VVEGSVLPAVVLAVGLRTAGLQVAVLAAFACSCGLASIRLLRGGRVSGLLVLSIVALATRTAFAVATGDAHVYFLQPVLSTLLVGGAFAITPLVGVPLSWRLANDFVHLPVSLLADARVGATFRRLSFAWALVHLTKALATVVLLWSLPLEQFVLVKPLLSLVLMGSGIALSFGWVRRTLPLGGSHLDPGVRNPDGA
jgi:hypothetical protein